MQNFSPQPFKMLINTKLGSDLVDRRIFMVLGFLKYLQAGAPADSNILQTIATRLRKRCYQDEVWLIRCTLGCGSHLYGRMSYFQQVTDD